MEEKYDIGRQLATLNHLIRRSIEKEIPSELMKISTANGYVLFYLHDHGEEDVFQKDFEETFGITRSTASKILSLMEAKGLVKREGVAGDARLKKITITAAGEEMRRNIIAVKEKMEERLLSGFSPAEISCLDAYIERMKNNVK